VTLNPRPDGPGFLPSGAEGFLGWEPREAVEPARDYGWRDGPPPAPRETT